MNPDELADLISQPEGQFIEFKREWYDFSSAREKAKFARDVVAMANGLRQGQLGHVVIGRVDPERGGEIVGVEAPPTSEQVTEILAKHARPVPDLRFFPSVEFQGKCLSVIEVRWSNYHPHYSTRDVESILSTDRVLVRQGKTTRHLSPPELEMMIRAKDARIGSPATDGPLVVGFVDFPSGSGATASVRVRNVSDEPVNGISAVVDVERLFPRGFTYRMNPITNLSLGPDESREFSFRPTDARYYYTDGTPLKDDGKIWSRWFNLTLHLTYRDRHGIIQTVIRRLALAG